MKKILKYLVRSILAIVLLLFLIVLLIYLPPVQNYLKEKAVDYVASHYGLTVEVGHFRLGFPLELMLEDVYAGHTATDTLMAAGSVRLKVGLGRIFGREVSVDDLTLQRVKLNLTNDTTGMVLKVAAGELDLKARTVDLRNKRIEVDYIQLGDGQVDLTTGKSGIADTTTFQSFDWTIVVDKLEFQRIVYRMNTVTLPFLGAGLAEGRIVGGKVAIGKQTVEVDSVRISGAWCDMRTAAAGVVDKQQTPSIDTTVVQPWTVQAGTVELDNSAFSMSDEGGKKTELVVSGIGIQMDSVYNQGTVVRAKLKDLKAVQKDGLSVTSMQANVVLDSAETILQGAYLLTPNSWIRLDARTAASVQHVMERVPLAVVLEAQIGLADVLPFYPDLPVAIRHQKVNVNTSLTVSADRLKVGQIILDMPGHFKITGSGSMSAYRDIHKMRGSFILRGEMPDVTFAQSYLAGAGVQIPRNIDMLARLKAERGDLETLLRFCCGQGCLTLDAGYQPKLQVYDAELTLTDFPLDRFLPADSLGLVSADIRLSGKSFSWKGAKADVNARIEELRYRHHDYRDILLSASLDKTRLQGTLSSRDADIPLDLIFRGDSVGQDYVATLSGRIGVINMEALHFVANPFTVAADLDLRATMGPEDSYTLGLKLDSLRMSDSLRNYTLGNLVLNMDSDRKKTSLDFESGDLKIQFQADTSLPGFINNIGKVAQIVRKQIRERNIDMELVREDLPPFSLQITGAQKNAVAGFLKTQGIGFKNLMVDVVSRKRSGIRFGLVADAPYLGSVRLDSVQLGAWQTGKSLIYSLSAGSSTEAWKGLLNINMTGRMQGDRFRVELNQKDAEGKTGFDLGVNLTMGDTTMTVSFFPMTPILGYSRWIVNADNRVVIGQHGRIDANLRMSYMNKLVSLQSLPDEGETTDRLQIEIAGINLGSLSQTVPFMPQLNGELSTDLMLYTRGKNMGADGNIRIAELGYEQQRIGTVELGLQYAAGNRFTEHAVDFELKIDSIRRALAKGSFSTSETSREVKVDVDIPSFPMYIANAFIPGDLIRLAGELYGEVHFRGTVDHPSLNGELAFRDGKADVVMLGTTFKLDTNRLSVRDGKIVFRNYRFIAPNQSDMLLSGEVVLTPFDRMSMNLAVDAADFEVVNVKKNETSLIYGRAYADIHSRISGAFSALSVTGNVNLLNRTAITYTLRESGPGVVDKSVDLVRFVSFRDTTLNEKDLLTNRIHRSSFALKMLIEIGDQVSVGVDLSPDGSNHVAIQGGGNLVLVMNPESGMALSGKYILTGGTVVYNVPIAGKKEFSIRNGSFVEWTGNVTNPLLSISASEAVKATVEDGDRNRLVTFESIIRIQNTLSQPDISFDLSAPSDMVIQNQLATFSPDERTRQALNLLIYNTYTAPGAAKSGSGGNVANNAIYGFVENELNKYTRKAGFTVGVDSYNTDENTTRTDYTYQFSRQLFNDRVRVKIGGRISTDSNEGQSDNLQDNLVDDISIEYVLTTKRNLYVKVFRHSNYESVLDGEVVQTGIGIVWRKNFRKFKDLFKKGKK